MNNSNVYKRLFDIFFLDEVYDKPIMSASDKSLVKFDIIVESIECHFKMMEIYNSKLTGDDLEMNSFLLRKYKSWWSLNKDKIKQIQEGNNE